MEYQLIDEAEVTEPVTLEEVKAYSQIDEDYSSDDIMLDMMTTTARVRLEQFLNIGFVKREITLQWNGYPVELPLSPTFSVVSLKDKDGTLIDADNYTLTKYNSAKLWINSLVGGNFEWFYRLDSGTVDLWSGGFYAECNVIYTAVYETGYETLPKPLKQALLAEVDYLVKLRGMPPTDVVSKNAALLAKGYSRNLIL